MKIHVCDGCGVDLDDNHMVLHSSFRVEGVTEVCHDCYDALVKAVLAAERALEKLKVANVKVAIANLVARPA